jgi:hypothetical protein
MAATVIMAAGWTPGEALDARSRLNGGIVSGAAPEAKHFRPPRLSWHVKNRDISRVNCRTASVGPIDIRFIFA